MELKLWKILNKLYLGITGILKERTENVCHDEHLESLEFSTLTPLDCNIPNVSIK